MWRTRATTRSSAVARRKPSTTRCSVDRFHRTRSKDWRLNGVSPSSSSAGTSKTSTVLGEAGDAGTWSLRAANSTPAPTTVTDNTYIHTPRRVGIRDSPSEWADVRLLGVLRVRFCQDAAVAGR